ncbi:MAG TPA: DUF4142 domain-containing protein [Candidatus Tumulicola sp.]|nr:DUF4142 domain-containing protein [Candidatus Tumulicola sp.]
MNTLFKRASYLGIAASVALLTACTGNVQQNPSESATAGPAAAQTTATPSAAPQGASDSDFAHAAAQIEAGRYALAVLGTKKAQSADLQHLARAMASDAAASSRWLDGYARKHGLPAKVTPRTRAMYQYSQMSGLSGSAFDRAFAQAVSTDAALSLDRFQAAASGAHDPALRAFAKRAAMQLQSDASRAGAH